MQTSPSEREFKAQIDAQDLGPLNVPELTALAQQMLARLSQQSQHIAEQGQVIDGGVIAKLNKPRSHRWHLDIKWLSARHRTVVMFRIT